MERVLHGRKGVPTTGVTIGLAEQSSGQGGALFEQLVEHAGEILAGRRLTVLECGTQPCLTDQLLDERAADPLGALNELIEGAGIERDASAIKGISLRRPSPSGSGISRARSTRPGRATSAGSINSARWWSTRTAILRPRPGPPSG